MAELSDAQFERLVGMLADNRVAVTQLTNDVDLWRQEVQRELQGMRHDFRMQGELLRALEGDVAQIQRTQRAQDQALDGITQLCKTTFDLHESLQKHIHGESSSIQHGESAESPRAQ